MLLDDVDELLKKSGIVERHTFFQLNFFVIGKEPTVQAKIHRCLEEMKSRKNSIEAIKLEIEELSDKKDLLILQKPENEIINRQLQRKINSTDNSIHNLGDKLKCYEEELQFFYQAYQQLVVKEPRKDWDDLGVQLEYWNAKLGQDIRARLIMNQPIDVELVKTIMSLPDKVPVKQQLVEMINGKKTKCPYCGGTGRINDGAYGWQPCANCNGTGYLDEKKEVENE
jgi:hypothetical protein